MLTWVKKMHEQYQLPEVRVRLVSGPDSLYSQSPITGPEDAVRLLQGLMKDLDREMICVVSLDQRNRPINYSISSIGTINQTIASVRDSYKAAILSNAASVILAHNHPSGIIEPSKEDFDVTSKFTEAGRLLDVPLLDHVIIGAGNTMFYSFKEHGSLELSQDHQGFLHEKSTPYKTRQEEVKALSEKLEAGLKDMLDSDHYRRYLDMMAKFPSYSFGNCMLIALQTKGQATRVCGYRSWETLGRHVRQGEKAIRILAPMPYKTKEKVPVIKDGGFVYDEHGIKMMEEKTITRVGFKPCAVFDYAQTEGEALPEIVHLLKGEKENVEGFLQAIRDAVTVPVFIEHIDGAANGFFSRVDQKIVIDDELPDIQKIKTGIHEAAHSLMHSSAEEALIPRGVKELEAESVATIVCNHFGIDSSDYSLGYINEWAPKDDLSDFKESLDRIQKTSCRIIDGMEQSLKMQEQLKEKCELASLREAPEKVLTPSRAMSM